MALTQVQVAGEGYEDTARRLLASADDRLARSEHEDLEQVIALGNAWATLAIHDRLAAIEFYLSQKPRG